MTELLKGHIRDKKHREYLDLILSSSESLLTLINDILDYSKIEAGKIHLESKRFLLRDSIGDTLRSLAVRAHANELELIASIDPDVPDEIVGDLVRLRQIIVNLVSNAIKFTHDGQVELSIQCLKLKNGVATLEFSVIDSGIGMSESAVAKIFDPFSQADASVTRRFGGTGLGLSISKRFAEALGGQLTVTSKEGVGSVFEVRIDASPMDDVDMIDPSEDDLDSLPNEETRAVIHLPDLRVLLVDDAEENRDLMSVILAEAGTTFVTAENGVEAMEKALSQEFDVVLMDMNMPVMDGYTATRQLRAQGYNRPIIALTAHAMDGDREKCVEVGCNDYTTKPIRKNT